MRVLYNRPERIFNTVFSAFSVFSVFFTSILIGAFQTVLINGQNPSARAQDWTLPFKPCAEIVSERTDIKQIASDNKSTLYISTIKGDLESIDFPANISNPDINNSGKNPVYKSNWQITLGSEIISNIIADESSIYAASKSVQAFELIKLRAISKLTGITNWQIDLQETDSITLIRSKYLYVFADRYLLIIDPNTGKKLSEIEQNFGKLARQDAYSVNPGNLPSDKNSPSGVSLIKNILASANHGIDPKEVTQLAENAETVFIGSKNGDLQAFHIIKNKRLWRGKVGGEISGIIFFGQNRVLVSSLDNFLYMFSAGDGSLIWKRRLADRLTGKPLIIDKIAFIANKGDSKAFMIELSGGKVINRISLPESHYLTANSIFIPNRALISTNRGILPYSRNPC